MDMETLLADLTSDTQTAAAETTTETPTAGEQAETETTETKTEEQSSTDDATDEGEGEDKATDDKTDEDAEGEKDAEGEDDEKAKREPRSRRMKRQLEALRAENEALRASQEAARQDAKADAQPKFETFNGDYDAYEAARIAWAARAALREQQAVLDRQRETRVQNETQAEVLREFQGQQTEARKALPDFDQVLAQGTAPVARHVGELIIESDKAALLQYHLAQRPELLHELNQLQPRDAARRIGRLEARLSLPKPQTATKAPPPPKTEPRGGATPRSQEADLDAWITSKYGKKRS
jgi:hypothetical protein